MASIIKDVALAAQGKQKIQWAKGHMQVLRGIAETFAAEKPLKGLKVTDRKSTRLNSSHT